MGSILGTLLLNLTTQRLRDSLKQDFKSHQRANSAELSFISSFAKKVRECVFGVAVEFGLCHVLP